MNEEQLQQIAQLIGVPVEQLGSILQAAYQAYGEEQFNQWFQGFVQLCQKDPRQAQQYLAQTVDQIKQQSGQTQMARQGAVLQHMRKLNGLCPDGSQPQMMKNGKKICKRCEAKKMQEGSYFDRPSDPLINQSIENVAKGYGQTGFWNEADGTTDNFKHNRPITFEQYTPTKNGYQYERMTQSPDGYSSISQSSYSGSINSKNDSFKKNMDDEYDRFYNDIKNMDDRIKMVDDAIGDRFSDFFRSQKKKK